VFEQMFGLKKLQPSFGDLAGATVHWRVRLGSLRQKVREFPLNHHVQVVSPHIASNVTMIIEEVISAINYIHIMPWAIDCLEGNLMTRWI